MTTPRSHFRSPLRVIAAFFKLSAGGWEDLTEAYIGGDLERTLAKRLALGDIDPVTLEPMSQPEEQVREQVVEVIDLDGARLMGCEGNDEVAKLKNLKSNRQSITETASILLPMLSTATAATTLSLASAPVSSPTLSNVYSRFVLPPFVLPPFDAATPLSEREMLSMSADEAIFFEDPNRHLERLEIIIYLAFDDAELNKVDAAGFNVLV
ncbi:hypothetical protein EV360DRAFT_74443 [Lentinula raphanica]|nr:hypothetical protein EV360DRAFT_74443 [Lentinula raphanica]